MADEIKFKGGFRIKANSLYRWPNMVTLVPIDLSNRVGGATESIAVALSDRPIEQTKPATRDFPERKITISPANQMQLGYLFNEGNPHVEKIVE